jgi:hypothetical protein
VGEGKAPRRQRGDRPVVAPAGQDLVPGWAAGEWCERRRGGDQQGANGSHHRRSLGSWGAARDDLDAHQRLEDVSQEPKPCPRHEPAIQGAPARRRRLPQTDREPRDHHGVEDRVANERWDVRGEEGTVVEKGDEREVGEEAEDEEGGARHLEGAEETGRGHKHDGEP